MKHLTIIIYYILFLGQQTLFGQNKESIIIGNRFNIYSEILNEERAYLLSLPDSYDDVSSSKKYPVLILLDGYSFFKATSGIVHFMSSDRNGNHFIPETIIVAIENVDRERDFTVTKLETKRPNTMGGGKTFLDFIEKELIPYVDMHYRTEPYRVLTGHSLGGLLTLNTYMDGNSLFNAYISIDPSIWWGEKIMVQKVDSIPPLSFNKKLYLATANQGEANYQRNKKRHDTLYALMKERSENPLNVKLDYFENEDHRSVPLIAIYEGLKYVYRNRNH